MDTSDDYDLPEIILDSSVTEADRSISFEMPDAATIAAQRKLAQEQDDEIKRFQEESLIKTADDLPSELFEDMKKVPSIRMPEEPPGVQLTNLDRIDVVGNLSKARRVFLIDLMDKLCECNDAEIAENLTWYLDSLHLSSIENPLSFQSEDIHCNVIALALLSLDNKCQKCLDVMKLKDLVLDLLNRTGRRFQSQDFLLELTENLLNAVHHFHNRIALARLFNNANVNSENEEYFSRKLSLSITFQSLSELLGYSRNKYCSNVTAKELKDIVLNGPRWTRLNPYEQYGMMIMIMNILETHSVIEKIDTSVLKELMLFLSSIKCNEKWNSGEFLKVKNLISKTKLFVQSRQYESTLNLKKSPLKQMRSTELRQSE